MLPDLTKATDSARENPTAISAIGEEEVSIEQPAAFTASRAPPGTLLQLDTSSPTGSGVLWMLARNSHNKRGSRLPIVYKHWETACDLLTVAVMSSKYTTKVIFR